MQERKKIISQLVEARLEKGISQAELAGMIGTQRSNICRLDAESHAGHDPKGCCRAGKGCFFTA